MPRIRGGPRSPSPRMRTFIGAMSLPAQEAETWRQWATALGEIDLEAHPNSIYHPIFDEGDNHPRRSQKHKHTWMRARNRRETFRMTHFEPGSRSVPIFVNESPSIATGRWGERAGESERPGWPAVIRDMFVSLCNPNRLKESRSRDHVLPEHRTPSVLWKKSHL